MSEYEINEVTGPHSQREIGSLSLPGAAVGFHMREGVEINFESEDGKMQTYSIKQGDHEIGTVTLIPQRSVQKHSRSLSLRQLGPSEYLSRSSIAHSRETYTT